MCLNKWYDTHCFYANVRVIAVSLGETCWLVRNVNVCTHKLSCLNNLRLVLLRNDLHTVACLGWVHISVQQWHSALQRSRPSVEYRPSQCWRSPVLCSMYAAHKFLLLGSECVHACVCRERRGKQRVHASGHLVNYCYLVLSALD